MQTAIVKNKTLLIIGVSETVSNIGNWITMMAVMAMLVFKSDGSVTETSGIFMAGLLPTLFFSPVAGWLCDRFDRKKLMIISETFSGLIILSLVFVDHLFLIYLVLALQAISISVLAPARQAVIPDIVPEDQLSHANAFLQQLNGLTKIFAPILAGALLAVVNPHNAILLDVSSFFISALILTRLPDLPTKTASETIEEQRGEREGSILSVIRTSNAIRTLFTALFLAIFVIIGFDILSPIYVRDILSAGEQFYGLMIGMVGIGTVLVTIYLMFRKQKRDPWKDLVLGLGLLSLIPLVLTFNTYIPSVSMSRTLQLAAAFIGGMGNGLLTTQASTLLQLSSPKRLLGRLGGVFQTVAVTGQLGGLILTPLLVPNILSMRYYFLIAGIAILSLCVWVFFFTGVKKEAIRSSVVLADVE